MNRTTLSTGLLFALLVIGYAVMHAMVAMGLVASFVSDGTVSEAVQLTKTGEVLIQRVALRAGQSFYDRLSYHQLDGTEIPAGEIQSQLASAVSLQALAAGQKPSRPLSTLSSRIASLHDRGTPPTYWYLMASATQPARMYLVGYDKFSKRKVGYLGMQGFRTHTPEIDEQFTIRTYGTDLCTGAIVTSCGQIWNYNEAAEPAWQDQNPCPAKNVSGMFVWVLSGDTVYEIDARKRSVRPLVTVAGAMSLSSSMAEQSGQQTLHLLLRTPRGVVVLDPSDLRSTEYSLPPPHSGQYVTVLELGEGASLVTTITQDVKDLTAPVQYDFQWMAADGTVSRTAEYQLPSRRASEINGGVQSAGLIMALPVPLMPAVVFTIAPVLMQWDGDPRDYTEIMRDNQRPYLIWIIGTLAIGGWLGWRCRQREVNFHCNQSWVWPIVVGLLGWFGWIGYRCLRPLPAKLPNGQWMRAHPEPNRPLGYEVIA